MATKSTKKATAKKSSKARARSPRAGRPGDATGAVSKAEQDRLAAEQVEAQKHLTMVSQQQELERAETIDYTGLGPANRDDVAEQVGDDDTIEVDEEEDVVTVTAVEDLDCRTGIKEWHLKKGHTYQMHRSDADFFGAWVY